MIWKPTVLLAFVESWTRRPCAVAAASRCLVGADSAAVIGCGVVGVGVVDGAGVVTGGLGVTVITTGGAGALTVICSVVVALTPRSSVVVSVTV